MKRFIDGIRGLGTHFSRQPEVVVDPHDALNEAIDEGGKFEALTKQPGWNALQNQLAERFNLLSAELRGAVKMDDVIRLQASLKELENILSIVPNAVSAAAQARKQLDELEIAHE